MFTVTRKFAHMLTIIIEQLLIKRTELAAAYKVAPSQAIALEFADVQRALTAAYCKRHTIQQQRGIKL